MFNCPIRTCCCQHTTLHTTNFFGTKPYIKPPLFCSVKSRGQNIPSGYTPEAYPMGAVAPVAPIAPLPSDDYTGMKVRMIVCGKDHCV